MQIKSPLILILTLLFALGCKRFEAPPAKIPLEDFFRNPEKTYIKISPNGRYISYMAPHENRMNLFIQHVDDESVEQITFETVRDIGGYIWANDTRILFVKDKGGNEDYKLYSVNIDGSDLKCLTCFPDVRLTLIDELKEEPDDIIVGLNMRDSTVFDPYRLNIVTGELQMLAENPGNIIDWFTDHNGKLRLAVAVVGGANRKILYRDDESGKFETVLKVSWRDEFIPQFFTFDNKMIYALSNLGRDKSEVVVFDPKSRTETAIIFKNPDVDISKVTYSAKKKKLVAAHYITSKREVHFFDEQMEQHFKSIKSKLKGKEVVVASKNKNEDIFIIRTYTDKTIGSYYLYNTSNESLKKIIDVSPWLKEEHMADMKPIAYTSRDGLTIHGYLTLPKGVAAKNLPVVIHPHGGPWIRDYWGFNPEVQFLANRGYAVLQMNFRGSKGYGKDFWLKSVKQWGRNMQNDINDGAYWLIDEGIADEDRIAIYGSSWGGYAALAGVTFTPDLYACGIDYVGPSNMFSFLGALPPYWEPVREMFYELVGHPEKDSLMLASISPALHADKIKAPLLIAQGANDPRVKVEESNQMVDALKDRGIEVEYILREDEGHGFRNEENRFALYQSIAIFLEKHLLTGNK
ncbi:MAG TPA: S9 family peptidase [Bacteroidales bacterium]|nr:S9 family peptidase [Bacteroidales bacterium]